MRRDRLNTEDFGRFASVFVRAAISFKAGDNSHGVWTISTKSFLDTILCLI